MPVYIVLLGPPGAGKGTQARILADRLGVSHISSGDIFRENIKAQTKLGMLAKEYMDRGELVPDDVTIAMIHERLERPDCRNGALLDGFPRTPVQSEALEEMLKLFGGEINVVPYINVPLKVLVGRLIGRWTCKAQGHIFHEQYNPPKEAGRCDIDGSELYQREDDREETVNRRIRIYMEQTEPLIQYFRQQGVLVDVDGSQSIDLVSERLIDAISGEL